jgi:hypothetical protein
MYCDVGQWRHIRSRILEKETPKKQVAREASMPDNLKPVKPLLDDYRQALGLAFAIDDEKGARFFRSSLVQSIFSSVSYSVVFARGEAPPSA